MLFLSTVPWVAALMAFGVGVLLVLAVAVARLTRDSQVDNPYDSSLGHHEASLGSHRYSEVGALHHHLLRDGPCYWHVKGIPVGLTVNPCHAFALQALTTGAFSHPRYRPLLS